MPVQLAQHGGFCFGVRRAVDAVESAIASQTPNLYTLGDVIHNPDVIADFAARGVKTLQSAGEIEALPEGATLIIRAHGCGPEIFAQAQEKRVRLIDATCPFVKRVQELADSYGQNGYTVYIAGRKNHPEVIGICGWSHERAHVIENSSDVYEADPSLFCQKAIVVAQTTITREAFERIVALLCSKIPDLQVFDTICATTSQRQIEAEAMAKQSDCVLVLGGKMSSNTQKLYEISKKYCKNTQLIENPEESPLEKIRAGDIISIIAGASTPNWMMMEVFNRMSELEKTITDVSEETAAGQAAVPDEPQEEVAVQETETEYSTEESDFMAELDKTLVRIRNGQVLTGTVVQVTDSEVSVNIGYKSDGYIPRDEFSSDPDVDPAELVKEGDEIEVEVIKVNDSEGNVLLSHKSVQTRKAWDAFVDKAEEDGAVFEAMGREVVKGGLIAYIEGVRTFIPASQVSNRYVENLTEFVGQPLRLKILEVDRQKRRVVASQKTVLLEEAFEKKKEIWDTLVVGERRSGIIRRLTDFGAFVDIGGIDGLVHVTEMAWGRVKHPKDVFQEGDEIDVVIKALDAERERISLGYKELLPDPWSSAAERYPVGSTVEGKVVRIKPFGAFVSLENRIDGLVHISQVATKRIEKVEDELKIGESIRVKVLSVDQEAKRISLSRREVLMENESLEDMLDTSAAEEEVQEESYSAPPEEAKATLADVFPPIEDPADDVADEASDEAVAEDSQQAQEDSE